MNVIIFETDGTTDEFDQRVLAGLREVIQDPQYSGVLDLLRKAFEFRREYPWLRESGYLDDRSEVTGVVGALEMAFSSYVDSSIDVDFSMLVGPSTNEKWRDTLVEAVNKLQSSEFKFRNFSRYLKDRQVAETELLELKRCISIKLFMYWKNRENGLGPDPW